jgi:glycosyltransferase involved in cell wall biosynthesis
MKVLFVCTHLKTGGVERQWSILLPALRERGLEVGLLTLTAEGDFFAGVREAGVPAEWARMRSRADLFGLRRALKTASWKPGVVVSNSVLGAAVSHALARRAGAAHVVTDHSIVPTLSASQHLVRRLLARRVDRVIAVTEHQIPTLIAAGYRPERISVVQSGIPELAPTRDRASVRTELGLQENDFAAFLIATLRPEKRADFFLDAVLAAHELHPRVRGVIVGRGKQLQRIRSLAESTDGVVQVLGEREDVPELIGAADVVCLSSSSEALPMVVIEAMALGRPVLATNVGGTSDLVVAGETGDLVDPDDRAAFTRALTGLAADPARRERYGRAARGRYARLFTVDRMVDAYADLLHSYEEGRAGLNGAGSFFPTEVPPETAEGSEHTLGVK